LAGLLDALQIVEPVSLAGLSMGGYIALAFWRRHAARLGKLMLCDTRAAGDTPQVVEGRMATIERVRAEGASAAAEAMLPKLFAASTSSKQPKLVEQTRQVILNTSADTLAAALRGMAQRPDMRPELAKLSVPTLLLCGAEDAITPPAEMHSLTSALPHASYIEIAEAGHMSPLEQPDAVASAIETFLRTP
jgi:pimeloyl-ACP methyl ester carboxylesterase